MIETSILASRYASPEMVHLFSPNYKYATWRKLWVALAKAQKELGLPIEEKQITAMQEKIDVIDFEKVCLYEKKLKHDVMAHIHAFGEEVPIAKGIIHLGATSCYVTDNTDLIQMREGLFLLQRKLIDIIRNLSKQARKQAHLPCLSYTHLQPAQLTTIGKRICLWIQDLLLDLEDLNHVLEKYSFLGVKGATGTQASFLDLFEGNSSKVQQLEEKVAQQMGFTQIIPLSGQTYSRKQDVRIFQVLSSLAVSAHKFGTDLRLLAHMREMEEPFSETQVGSSAMPHKRNPIRAERLCGLARYLLSLQENPNYTAATQWLERTLDDSSNRRLSIPSAFLTADAVLNLLHYLTSNLIIYPKIIEKRIEEELPFLATEPILMASVKKGKNRQELHEALRFHSQEVSMQWKLHGEKVNLLEKICNDPLFSLSEEELKKIVNPVFFVGRAPEQVKEFLDKEVFPLLSKYQHLEPYLSEIEI